MFDSNAITMDFEALGDKDTVIGCTVNLTKEATDSSVKYNMAVTVRNGDVTLDALSAAYEYEKSSGDFSVSLTVSDKLSADGEKATLTLNGNIKADGDTASIKATSLKVADTTLSFNLSVTFDANAQIPAAPADVKDIVDLTDDELLSVLTDIQNSKLGKLMESFYQQDQMYGAQAATVVFA